MMAEWYRRGMSFEALIHETLDFVRLFVGDLPTDIVSYKEAFTRFAGFDPYHISDAELEMRLHKLDPQAKADSRDDFLNYILALEIEPHLGKDTLTALAYYPKTQAALAKTALVEGEVVAERFEVYYQGVELANGYHELQDAKEQLKRLQEANLLRKELKKNTLPIDMRFIQALETGLPECSGVAVGFDRLMMLRHQKNCLADIMPFDYQQA
jgi:elongation factor P--(R)-beta-lysine ligase